ncbi:MAG: hypothetical protein H6936_06775 [Burkholderiales bacterium]|nr:hypothetical protein [Nitrosomonas sp.]MCP5274545.1 hypothetical protein [Burkholderiales bacterium]
MCLVIVTASLGLHNPAIADGFSFSAGMDFTQGKYGGATTTDIWYVPFTGRYTTGRASARLTIPYLNISGPGNILGPGLVDIIDSRIGLNGGDIASIGTSDIGGGGVFICTENQLAVSSSSNPSFCLDNSTDSGNGSDGENSESGSDDNNSGSGSGDVDGGNSGSGSGDDNAGSGGGDDNSGPGNSDDDPDSESGDDNSGPGNSDDDPDSESGDDNSGPGNSDDDPNSESGDDNSGSGSVDDNSGSGSDDDTPDLDSVDDNSGTGSDNSGPDNNDDLTITAAEAPLKSHSDEEPIGVIPDASAEADAIDVDAISRRTASGLGDIVAALTYNLIDHKSTGIAFDITGRVKFPTASASQRLGSGEFDYAVQGDLFKSIAKFNIRTTFGYKFLGDPQGVTLQNVFYGGAGVGYRILPRATIGTSFNIAQSALRLQDSRALSVYYSHRLGDHFRLNFYGLKGFSDRSPDWGSGLTLLYAF